MKISVEDVKYIAKLAKLRFDEEEALKLAEEFEEILAHFQSIGEMDLDAVDLNRFPEGQKSVVRPDRTTCGHDKAKLFRNVKSMRGAYIQVPKILEQ